MFTRQRLADLAALAGLALAVFLAGCILTFDPYDPPATAIHPPRAEATNLFGTAGAYVAHLLFAGIGWGAYLVLVTLGVLVAQWIGRKPITEPLLRGAGWMLTLVGGTTILALLAGNWSAGAPVGPGGYLGAMGRVWLESHFATVGGYLFAASVVAAGLLLVSDHLFLKVLRWVFVTPPLALVAYHRLRQQAAAEQAERDKVYAVANGATADAALPAAAPAQADEEYELEATDDASDATDDLGLPPHPAELVVKTPQKAKGKAKGLAAAATASTATTAALTAAHEGAAEIAAAAAKGKSDKLKINKPSQKNIPTAAEKEAKTAEKSAMLAQLDAAAVTPVEEVDYELPSIELLSESEPVSYENHEQDVRRKAHILEQTFANFGFNVRVVEIDTGPVIAQFEVELEAGLRLSKITSLADDLAIALRVPSVRIVAPIPGKNTVGIEVPNAERQLVRMRDVIEESTQETRKMRIPIFLGKDVSGKPLAFDLTSMPHLLIAGRTGTGKSVCLNSIIASILMTRRPDEVKLLLIDPKMVELSSYKKVPHLMHPVVTDMKKAEAILGWAVEKMEERYALLARAGVRHIGSYNQLGRDELVRRLEPENEEQAAEIPETLPFIVIVADEMADLMMTAAKEVETHIIRLAQKSRAVGIHLVLATQKPTVDVITGLIKSNLPARISFQVASRVDSRVVLDEMGADKLLGNGDLLFLWPGTSMLIRGQGTYISDEEINSICDSVATTEPQFATELVKLKPKDENGATTGFRKDRDELYEAAIDIVIREGRGSVSLLQRALGIGYGRAARLVDFMAEDGIVGEYNGSQAREVVYSIEQWEALRSGEAVETTPIKAAAKAASGGAATSKAKSASKSPAKASAVETDEPIVAKKPRTNTIKLSPRSASIHEDEPQADAEDLFAEPREDEVLEVDYRRRKSTRGRDHDEDLIDDDEGDTYEVEDETGADENDDAAAIDVDAWDDEGEYEAAEYEVEGESEEGEYEEGEYDEEAAEEEGEYDEEAYEEDEGGDDAYDYEEDEDEVRSR